MDASITPAGDLLGLRRMGGGIAVVFYANSPFPLARFALDESAHRALRARLR
jgi:hypothetical protein